MGCGHRKAAGVDGPNGPFAGHAVPVACAGDVGGTWVKFMPQGEFEEQVCPDSGICRDLPKEKPTGPGCKNPPKTEAEDSPVVSSQE